MAGLLIVTCGTTDLQYVAQSPTGDAVRLEATRFQQRMIHERLLAGKLSYLVDRTAESLKVMRENQVGLVDDAPAVLAFGGGRTSMSPSELVLDRPLRLVPAKLASLPDVFEDNLKPDTIIVFNTHRDHEPFEPIAAGKILSRWLAEEFRLNFGRQPGDIRKGAAGWVNFLDGKMPAEGRDGGPVNLDAVQRMDDALQSLEGRWKDITLAITGGLPNYRDQIRALVRFRFRTARIFEFEQGLHQTGEVRRLSERRLPSDAYRLRHEVRTRVRRGDFVAAAAVAWQGGTTDKKSWGKPVLQAAEYLNGMLAPSEDLPDYLLDLVRPNVPRCLLPAMRVETALRTNRQPEAVLWTFAFFDAALVDGIASLPFVSNMNELLQSIDVADDLYDQIPEELLEIRPNRKPCLKVADGRKGQAPRGQVRLLFRTERLINDIWIRHLGEIGRHLNSFDQRLSDRNGLEPKSLRNSISHSSITPDRMAALRDRFVSLGIWRKDATPDGFFLGQREVVAIIMALGMGHPARVHDRIVNGLSLSVESARLR